MSKKDLFWRKQVKETRNTASPELWFSNFRSYQDADEFFTALCGPDWEQEPWAKFLMYGEGSEKQIEKERDRRSKFDRFEYDREIDGTSQGRIINMFVRDPKSHEYMVRHYVRCGIVNVDTIVRLEIERYHRQMKFDRLYDPGYGVNPRSQINRRKIQSLVNKYIRLNRKENPDGWVVDELVKYYTDQGKPLRDIEKYMRKDGVSIGRSTIHRIQRRIKELEQNG